MSWIITKDNLSLILKDDRCAIGVQSVGRSVKAEDLPFKFRMRDGDGAVYYYGRSDEENFDPLDDFGNPNAGCTSIEYNTNGRWVEL